ncbi:MAG: heme exporter protein CcmB [Gammaproteobacteria bacterium]|nr:heme exporter protein CcmB [Gammaproteobacteria bacterium]TVQ45215.1 MAG: heme exporter protein CcmB [Gammaproteobacteria bacterium]
MSGAWTAAGALARRDLRAALRRWGELALPLCFFVIVLTLFPLGLAPERDTLAAIGPGVLWVAALLASLLALETLFRGDMDDGSMEQLVLSPQPLALLALVKALIHWLLSGLPLVLLTPLVAQAFYLPTDALWVLALALLLATPTLSLIGAVAAALTASLRRGAGVLGILVLPLAVPLLVFGARATDLAIQGQSAAGPLYLLAALLALAITLAPLAIAAALRISVD